MSTLLIYAVGHTDVQLIDDGERRELEKKRSKELHAELAGRSHDWQLEDSPARRHREPVPSKDRREASLFPARQDPSLYAQARRTAEPPGRCSCTRTVHLARADPAH